MATALCRCTNKQQVLPKVIWGEPRRHPSRQRMDSPAACAIICAMLTAEESNHSAAGTLHPHRTDWHTTTAYRDRPTDGRGNKPVRISAYALLYWYRAKRLIINFFCIVRLWVFLARHAISRLYDVRKVFFVPWVVTIGRLGCGACRRHRTGAAMHLQYKSTQR